MSTRIVTSALLAGTLLLAGCGGDDPASTEVAATARAELDGDASEGEVVGAIDREAEGGERPESLPDDVPVPAGLQGVLSMGSDGRTQSFSGHVVGGTPTDVRDGFADQLESAGWQVDRQDTDTEIEGMVPPAALEAEHDGRRYTATFVTIGELVTGQFTYTDA